jgi:hypothetical protein
MALSRFPYEQSEWRSPEAERWLKALKLMGPENVRAILTGAYRDTGSRAAVGIGSALDVTKGFAQEWLAWHDRQNLERDTAFRSTQIFWTRWAALAATVVAAAGVIGWAVTIWLSVKK